MSTSLQTGTIQDKAFYLPERGRFALAWLAFLALMRRDLVVIWREFLAFLAQVLLQPLFFLFVFGTILPAIGLARGNFGTLLLPGIVALTIVLTSLQGVALPLAIELGYGSEIADRLLAPLPISLVAIEKVIFASLRGLIAGTIIFPLAYLILGSQFNMRSDAIAVIIGVMILAALTASSLGLLLGTLVQPQQIALMFSVVLTPLLFTGCVQYPWGILGPIQWFQIVTLINPLTYASEGLRYAMVPSINGHPFPTLGIGWVLLGLSVSLLLCLFSGIRMFKSRVVN